MSHIRDSPPRKFGGLFSRPHKSQLKQHTAHMRFNIQLSIGGEVQGTGFYSNATNPCRPVSKHHANGISIGGRWISRAITANWHTAQIQTLPKRYTKKKCRPAQPALVD